MHITEETKSPKEARRRSMHITEEKKSPKEARMKKYAPAESLWRR